MFFMKTVFMFPGQGSQSVGMMSSLLEEFDVAQQVFDEASSAIGVDLKEIALQGPVERINQTAITQPIVLTASIAMWRVWESQTQFKPDFVCGHSLGEYNALFAAGAYDFETGLKLVKKRGELMSNATGGTMAAVIGSTEEQIKTIAKAWALAQRRKHQTQ